MTHQDLVDVVRQRMDRIGMTPYRLHVELKGQVSKQTVYNFVTHGEVIQTPTLIAIMNVLNLTITEIPEYNRKKAGTP
jgi:hypothetical protein